jgi:hypothetical protein
VSVASARIAGPFRNDRTVVRRRLPSAEMADGREDTISTPADAATV